MKSKVIKSIILIIFFGFIAFATYQTCEYISAKQAIEANIAIKEKMRQAEESDITLNTTFKNLGVGSTFTKVIESERIKNAIIEKYSKKYYDKLSNIAVDQVALEYSNIGYYYRTYASSKEQNSNAELIYYPATDDLFVVIKVGGQVLFPSGDKQIGEWNFMFETGQYNNINYKRPFIAMSSLYSISEAGMDFVLKILVSRIDGSIEILKYSKYGKCKFENGIGFYVKLPNSDDSYDVPIEFNEDNQKIVIRDSEVINAILPLFQTGDFEFSLSHNTFTCNCEDYYKVTNETCKVFEALDRQ